MSRVTVTDSRDGTVIPFLRGILTRSLLSAGISFEDAYAVASKVRRDLQSEDDVTTDGIRALAAKHLSSIDGIDTTLVQRYRAASVGGSVTVLVPDAPSVPYSRGRHRESLTACGISDEAAIQIAHDLHSRLEREGVAEISLSDVKKRTHALLGEHLGDAAARRYLAWEEFRHSDRPLLLLLGGTTGIGKSTIATRVASKLDIVRTQSTDMLREVMRTMVPDRLVPALHVSSFEAWSALPDAGDESEAHDAKVVSGYLRQCELLSVACEAAMERAARERVSLILEGVHVNEEFMERVQHGRGDAIVVSVILGLRCEKELRRRIKGRGRVARRRRSKRYLRHLDAILAIQSHLLTQAEARGIPIMVNDDLDTVTNGVLRLVMDELLKAFHGTPDEVFE